MNIYNLTKEYIKNIANSIFPRIFIIAMIAITIPTTVISLLSIRHSSNNIVKQVNQASQKILAEKVSIMEQKMAEIDNLIYYIVSNEKIWELQDIKEPGARQYQEMAEIIKSLNYAIRANKTVEAIYLYNDKFDYILSDVKHSKESFHDKEIFDYTGNDWNYVTPPRKAIIATGGAEREVISYIRMFIDIKSNEKIYIVANISYNVFFENIDIQDNNQLQMNMIVYNQDNILYFTDDSNEKDFIHDKIAFEKMNSTASDSMKNIDGLAYFINKIKSEKLGWTFIYYQRYDHLVQTATLVKNLILSSLAIVSLLSFMLACALSIYLYRPLLKIIQEVRNFENVNFFKGNNEYKIINDTLKKLFVQNHDLQSRYRLVFPYFQQHYINDLLTGKVFDAEKFKSIISLLGVKFIYSSYYTILIDFENSEITDRLKARFQSYFLKYDTKIIHIHSVINNHRMVIIINTEMDTEMLYTIICDMKEQFNKEGIELTISLGKPYNCLEKICMSYEEVLMLMDSKFFIGKDEIIYNKETETIMTKTFYNKEAEQQLINSIKSQDRDEAKRAMEEVYRSLPEAPVSIEYIKYVYFQIVTNVVHTMESIGIKLEDDKTVNISIFERIRKAETLHEMQSFIDSLIDDMIIKVCDLKKKQHTGLIRKTKEFIENNYFKDITLEDVSNEVFLSPRYLNSIFKEEGMTIYEYVTKCRMDAAKRLLLDNNKKIKDIAQTLGYKNVQSFIRFFKIYFYMTPMEYRRKISLCEIDMER